ncbi:glucoamylase family protein [Aquiflexum gelatinilyticum]|uniref:Beta-glucosidase n=1 Tax=Aquiflexum gelatinilyticum TaxID=2961943 RepID=A0A9X2P6F1_9BACT|nr:glucoamylase family protein [Aquiflexum gelatinilyticum]MCR9013964.1 beta-glucosidase [Aquiflexum gelatinilyticum]
MKIRHIFISCLLALSGVFSCNQKEVEILVFPYDSHIELQWPKIEGANSYLIFARTEGSEFAQRAETSDTLLMDFWMNKEDGRKPIDYKIEAVTNKGKKEIAQITTQTREMNEEELLDMVQFYTFRYFYYGAEPTSGMAPERIHIDGEYPENDAHIVTTGGTGFGIFGLIAGIERGWISKEQGLAHFEKMATFLEKADRYHGIWAHWIDGQTGKTKPFSPKDDGADLVESAFLMQGLLAVREYYRNGSDDEKALSQRINKLWEEMQWNFHTKNGENKLYWHWSPNFGWEMNFPLEGYNECLITYVLAAASPTFTIDPTAYHEGWARSGSIKNPVEAFGLPLQLRHNYAEKMGGPLFWAHYSYMGLDPRGLNDEYADYWEENQNQTLINRAWCIANPGNFKGYGEDLWGLTASYSINGYNAHHPGNDTGVISPTAALSSIPYSYEESMKVLKNLYFNYGDKVFGRYGFYDAMSLEHEFFPKRYLAIDQGPIVGMIENYRTGLGWKLFMQAPEISSGLEKLGFSVNKNGWEEQ